MEGVAGFARDHRIIGFLARRLLTGVATLVVVSMLIFVAVDVLPGDVASNVLGKQATPARVSSLRAELGLDRPLLQRYGSWLGGFVSGDLGDSLVRVAQRDPTPAIGAAIANPVVNSVVLAGVTIVILVPLSVLLGVVAAIREGGWVDHVISGTTIALVAVPEFVLGALLISLFFVQLGLLAPVSLLPPGSTALADPSVLVLPVLTLLGVSAASTARMVRACMVEVLTQDFVAMARLNGIAERRVLWRYALRNALAPSVQIVAQNVQYLLGGVIVVESLFSYSGIGRELVLAVNSRDATTVQAISMLLAVVYVAINIVADLVVVLLVPRLRTGAP